MGWLSDEPRTASKTGLTGTKDVETVLHQNDDDAQAGAASPGA